MILRRTLFLLFISMSGFAQIGAKVQQQSEIYGLWQNSQSGYQMTLMLNPDGSGEFDGEAIKFVVEAAKLSITQAGTTNVYNCMLSGNSLTLSGGDLDANVVFTRNGIEQPQTTAVATQTKSGNVTPEDIIGVWSGNGETIEFKPSGQCLYLCYISY